MATSEEDGCESGVSWRRDALAERRADGANCDHDKSDLALDERRPPLLLSTSLEANTVIDRIEMTDIV